MLKTRAIGGRQTSNTVSMPAPTGGWNASSPYADMRPSDAITLKNLIPLTLDVVSRGGSAVHVSGLGGAVESLFVYTGADGTQKLFGAANGKIFDCTAAGPVGAEKVGSLTSNQWQTVNFSTSAGNYLVAVNGADKLHLFSGSAWTAIDGTSTPAITGVTTSTLIAVNVYSQRLWFAAKDSLKVWYLPVGAVGGAAASVDLGNAFRRGGYVMAICTISVDAGAGSDDNIAFVTSNGEVAVYRGTDPTDATKWFRVGVYRIGSPMGRRCWANYGGDLLMLSMEGLGPLSQLVVSSQIDSRQSYMTDKIRSAISQATSAYKNNFGWSVTICPSLNLLWVNVPVSSTTSEQYAMNSITGSWCQITGWNAKCWEIFNDNPYFGGADGSVYRAFYGTTDSGNPIYVDGLTAFDSLGNSAQIKQALAAKLNINLIGSNTLNSLRIGVETDYFIRNDLFTHSFSATALSLSKFGTAKFDGTANFGSVEFFFSDWINLTGYGYSMALHAAGYLKEQIRWRSYDLLYQKGAAL